MGEVNGKSKSESTDVGGGELPVSAHHERVLLLRVRATGYDPCGRCSRACSTGGGGDQFLSVAYQNRIVETDSCQDRCIG